MNQLLVDTWANAASFTSLHREKDVEQNTDRLRENDGTIAGKDTPTEIDHALEEDTDLHHRIVLLAVRDPRRQI